MYNNKQIGEDWPEQGGLLAGVCHESEDQAYWLIVVPNEDLSRPPLSWGTAQFDACGANSETNGWANTQYLLSCGVEHPAAVYAANLPGTGFYDCYLPSISELEMIAKNCKGVLNYVINWSSTQADEGHAMAYNNHTRRTVDIWKRGRLRPTVVRRVYL